MKVTITQNANVVEATIEGRLDTVTSSEFEKQLASENLYSMCNIVRKTKPRGRPKSK